MRHDTITGPDYVRAINALLYEKSGNGSVSFDIRTYDRGLTKDDLPWSKTADRFIDTVRVPEDGGNDTVCIIVDCGNGQGLQRHFNGTEKEDWDHIFYDVYDELWNGDEEEAGEWLEQYMEKTSRGRFADIKGYLIRRIGESAAHLPVTLTRPWFDETLGVYYDTVEEKTFKGTKMVVLTDSVNGHNNPTAAMLTNLTATELLQAWKDIVRTAMSRSADPTFILTRTEREREEEVFIHRDFLEAVSLGEEETAAAHIRHILSSCGEGERIYFSPNDAPLPYTLSLDSFLGHMPESVSPFNGIEVLRDGENDFEIDCLYDERTVDILKTAESPDEGRRHAIVSLRDHNILTADALLNLEWFLNRYDLKRRAGK